MNRTAPLLIIVIVAVVALGGGWYFMRRSTTAAPPVNSVTPANPAGSPASAPAGPANAGRPGADPPHFRGAQNTAVTLEEFGDFQCPPCGQLYPMLKQIESQYGSRISVIFRQFPLVEIHRHALDGARAAEAAGMQGKFFEMHDLLYENQNNWKDAFDVRPIFEDYAKQIGLDVERFKRDVTSEQVSTRITLDGIRGHSLNVTGTPTLFLNGREVPFESLKSVESISGLID